MGHSLYCGVTESGKTTLARYHARRFDQLGHKNIVYDPVGTATAGGGWPARSIIFTGDDESKFMDYLSRHDVYHAHIWVDEAGDHFGVQDIENHWIFRRGRHKGFLSIQLPSALKCWRQTFGINALQHMYSDWQLTTRTKLERTSDILASVILLVCLTRATI